MNLIELIDQLILNEIKAIQKTGHAYLSFGLISQSIEFLGSIIDEFEFNEKGKSKNRFNNLINEFFDVKYHIYTDPTNPYNLYENLRCGLLHVMTPKAKLALTEISKPKVINGELKHLELNKFHGEADDRLVLVAETFYEDLEKASKEIIKIIQDKSIFQKFPVLNTVSTIKKDKINLISKALNVNLTS
ncbi:hypothetical protein [Leptospira brenneri]|uniref:hypothetical protein n=1 Tax=Leptospira brenneri TaxID=2023182 RepID=UPI000C29CE36|nr:hypothetical protein [Leptospira brenneri]PJZ43776.1 hypothetical protein CH361_18665 [Leptospira brenneri]